MQNSNKPTVIDIFCGCGGLSEGFKQAGFDVLLGIDNNAIAIKTYNKHNNNRGRIANVEEIDSNYIFVKTKRQQIDVMVGGPPCQAFSSVAIAKWRSLGIPGTIDHPLNKLYEEFLRLVKEVKPKFFVIENVERMFRIEEGLVRKVIESTIGDEFLISFYTENMADFGIPQYRKRTIVIGNRIGKNNPEFVRTHSKNDLSKQAYVTVKDAISDLPKINHNSGSIYMQYPQLKGISEYAKNRRKESKAVYNHWSKKHNDRDLKIFLMLKPGQSIKDLPSDINPYRSDIFTDKYKKQPWNKPSSTILAHLSKDGLMFIHPDRKQNRSLTPREAARLQSFDDVYTFEGPKTAQYSQIGNAVPPVFAKTVARYIKNILNTDTDSFRYCDVQENICKIL